MPAPLRRALSHAVVGRYPDTPAFAARICPRTASRPRATGCPQRLLHELFILTSFMSGHGLMRGGSQPLHGGAHAVTRTKNGRPGDQHVGSCTYDQWRRRRVDAPIHLEVTAGPDLVDHLAHTP